MSLSRKRKKELEKLQNQAGRLWQSQQVLLEEAGQIAREAGRQVGNYNREQIMPAVQHGYEQYAQPVVERTVDTSRRFYNNTLVPGVGAVVGSAMSVWDAANEVREKLAAGRGVEVDLKNVGKKADKYAQQTIKRISAPVPAPAKKRMGAGGVVALILGAAAAVGVLYAAWQTLRADDELWVADDPLRAPDA